MSQKKFEVTTSSTAEHYQTVPKEKVMAFNQRLNASMKAVNRAFLKKQKVSAEKAARIVLNA